MATIQGVYVALFGRPADPSGLAYFNGVTNNGANLAGIGNLAGQKEYTDRFTGMTNAQIVNSIYKSLFNRDAELAGLNFFTDALTKGTLSINNIAIAILDGAQGADKTMVQLKVAAADAFTKAIDTAAEVIGYSGNGATESARTFLNGVTTTAPTQAQIDAAVLAATTAVPVVPGVTLTLTADPDAVTLDQAKSEFKSTAGDDTIRALTAGHLSSADSIDGGAGNDTLNAIVDNTANAPVIKNVETINLTTGNAASVFNAESVTGAKEIWYAKSGTAADVLTLSNVALSTTVGFAGTQAADALTVGYAGATGSADAVSLAVKAGNAAIITLNSVETVNTKISGAATFALSGDKVETVNGSGDKAATVDLQGAAATLKTVDFSGYTGALTVDLSAALTNNVSVKLGTGADTLDLTGAAKVATVDLGAGSDTVFVDGGKAHVITTGAGSDTINIKVTGGALGFVAADFATADALSKAAITISDFTSGTDKINLDATAATITTLTGTQLATVKAEADLLAATNKALSLGAGAAQTIEFQFGSDSYLVVDNDGNKALSAGDALVKVTGVADLTVSDFSVA